MDTVKGSPEDNCSLIAELATWLREKCVGKGMTIHDAQDVTSHSIMQLIANWDKIIALFHAKSLKAWLETTATREYIQLIRKSKRNKTFSLQNLIVDDTDLSIESQQANSEEFDFENLPIVKEEQILLVQDSLKRLALNCQFAKTSHEIECKDKCLILWMRYSQSERPISLKELASYFGTSQSNYHRWHSQCLKQFKRHWNQHQ